MRIEFTVKYRSNNSGAGKLTATSNECGKIKRTQSTIGYPHELASSLKNYEAAARLEKKVERKYGVRLRLIGTRSVDSCMVNTASEAFVYEVFNMTVGPFANRDAFTRDAMPAGTAS